MKTLYLHIGLPKTGTSAIQSFLMANPEVLEKQGYCYKPVPFSYPKISKNRNCHFLVDNSYDEEGNYDAAQTRAKQEEGMQFVLNWFETYDSVILSDEALWVSSTRKAENPLDLVVEYSKKYNFALKVIVYIRRQDDLISSWWKQRVRTGKTSVDWNSFIADVPAFFKLDYQKTLRKIEKKVGSDSLVVRRYDRSKFSGPGNTIFSDFLETVGLTFNGQYVIPNAISNQSFPDNYTEIKRMLNTLRTENSSVTESDLIYFENLASRCTSELDHERTALFSTEERIAFLQRYEEGNQAVAKKYFHTEDPLFSENFSDTKKWDPSAPAQTEDIVRFFGMTCLQQHAEITSLKEQLSALKAQTNALQKQADANTRKLKPHVPGWWRVRRFFRKFIKK